MTALRRFVPLSFILLVQVLVWAAETGRVVKVVDGDTLKVEFAGRVETVRLIGVDTPETVHPRKPVEFFGKEASAFTRGLAEGQFVRLVDDPQNQNRDKYGRLLRYAFLPDGMLLNAEIIAQGYGHAYTRYPFTRMEEFRSLERQAREANRGLWGGNDRAITPAAATPVSAPLSTDGSQTVYITRTGNKYHSVGCRYLAKSSLPIALKDASSRYEPCSACGPPRLQAATTTAGEAAGRGDGTKLVTRSVTSIQDGASQTVYVTKSGTRYHRVGCRFLSKSQIPIPLNDAADRYAPCSVCAPPRPSALTATATESVPKAVTSTPVHSTGGRCQAVTKAGSQCKRAAAAGSRYCWQHQR